MAVLGRKGLRLGRKHERQSASAYFLYQWRGRTQAVEIPHPRDIAIPAPSSPQVKQKHFKEQCRCLALKLCKEHPSIVTDPEILGGAPCVKGTRLSVKTILAKLHLYGSVQDLVDAYEPHLSEEQVKEAIAYAQDFLEIACGTEEPEANG